MRVSAAHASVLVITACAVATFGTPANGSASIESQLLSHINAARTESLQVHSGLVAIARAHSQSMAAQGELDHGDWTGRIRRAPPDPAETNGAPDDGFTSEVCENAAWAEDPEDAMSESEVARKIYDSWRRSAPHHRCMVDPEVTVVGLGIYYETDEHRWWATLDAVEDRTPPESLAAPRAAAPAPPTGSVETPVPTELPRGEPEETAAPLPTNQPAGQVTGATETTPDVSPTPRVRSTFNQRVAVSALGHEPTQPFGGQELLAALGILAWTLLSYLGYARRAA